MRLTVGPLPASVYWRRRAIVLAGALLVLFLIAQACMAATAGGGRGAGDNPPDPPATGAATPDPTGTGDAGAADQSGSTEPDGDDPAAAGDGSGDGAGQPAQAPSGDQCTDDEIRVTALAERTEFTPGDPVQLTIVIRNDSDRTCRRDIGGDLRELSLVLGTGAERVWSSRDCGGPEGSDERQLPPDFESSYFLVWNGRASDTCDGDEPGGDHVAAGEYQLFARLGTDHSEPVTLTLRG